MSFVYWGSALALAVAAELESLRRKASARRSPSGFDGYRAGDLGLDPFGLADDEVRPTASVILFYFFLFLALTTAVVAFLVVFV